MIRVRYYNYDGPDWDRHGILSALSRSMNNLRSRDLKSRITVLPAFRMSPDDFLTEDPDQFNLDIEIENVHDEDDTNLLTFKISKN